MIVCEACGHRDSTRNDGRFCRGCQRFKSAVVNQVGYAIKKGIIQRASCFECVRCGKQAKEYDHRDYAKPMDIQPMCRSCNKRMPAGLMPANILEINEAYREREKKMSRLKTRQRAQQIGNAAEKQA